MYSPKYRKTKCKQKEYVKLLFWLLIISQSILSECECIDIDLEMQMHIRAFVNSKKKTQERRRVYSIIMRSEFYSHANIYGS